jgi:hypothetical protein
MSTSHSAARREAIAEVLRLSGHGHLTEFFVTKTDISADVLRAIAGLPPPPSPQEQRDIFRSLQ